MLDLYQQPNKIFFEGYTTDINRGMHYSFDASKLSGGSKEVDVKEKEDEAISLPNITIEGIEYYILAYASNKKYIAIGMDKDDAETIVLWDMKGENIIGEYNKKNYISNTLVLWDEETKKVIGEFETEKGIDTDFAVSPDANKVAYLERANNVSGTYDQNVYIKDFASGETKLVAQGVVAKPRMLRWINNNQITFQGYDSMVYWGSVHAYKYDFEKKKLTHFSDFQLFDRVKQPSVDTIFWSPDGRKIYYFVRNSNVMVRWK